MFLYTTTQYYTTYKVSCRHNFKLLKVDGGGGGHWWGFTIGVSIHYYTTYKVACSKVEGGVSRLVFLYNTTQYYTTYKLASTRNFKLLKVEGEGGFTELNYYYSNMLSFRGTQAHKTDFTRDLEKVLNYSSLIMGELKLIDF